MLQGPQNYTPTGTPSIEKKSSMEDLMFDLVKASSNRITTMENNVLIIVGNMHSMSTTMQSLVSTVASHEKAILKINGVGGRCCELHQSKPHYYHLWGKASWACNVVILRNGESLTESNAKEKLEAKKPMNLEEEVKEARNKAPKHTHLGKVAPTPEILPIDKLPYP